MPLLGKRRQSSLRTRADFRDHLLGLLPDLKDLGRNLIKRFHILGTGATLACNVGSPCVDSQLWSPKRHGMCPERNSATRVIWREAPAGNPSTLVPRRGAT